MLKIEIYQYLKSASNNLNKCFNLTEKMSMTLINFYFTRNRKKLHDREIINSHTRQSTCVISARNHPIFIINYPSSSQSSKLFIKNWRTRHTKSRAALSLSVDNYMPRISRLVGADQFCLDPENYSDNNGINYDNFLYMHILFFKSEVTVKIVYPYNNSI